MVIGLKQAYPCSTLPCFPQPLQKTRMVHSMKYWCGKSPQITNSSNIWSRCRILEQNGRGEPSLSSQGCQLERSAGTEKKDVQRENAEYPAMCVPTKQLKEKLRENTSTNHQAAVTSILLLARVQTPIHRIHLSSSAFDCPFSDYISHRGKLAHKKKLFKV